MDDKGEEEALIVQPCLKKRNTEKYGQLFPSICQARGMGFQKPTILLPHKSK